jgi:hypothetical protein
LTQTTYSRLRAAASGLQWHASAMKSLAMAVGILLVGTALISVMPEADLIPDGVRTVLDDVARIW